MKTSSQASCERVSSVVSLVCAALSIIGCANGSSGAAANRGDANDTQSDAGRVAPSPGGGDAAGFDSGQSSDGGTATDGGTAFTAADYLAVIQFDYQGENGVPFTGGASIGYPAGVPNSYSWKFGTTGLSDVAGAVAGRGPQLAGAAYDQIYQHRPGDDPAPNARVKLEHIRTYYFSNSSQSWLLGEDVPVAGAAFAEDFLDNQSTGADSRDEGGGQISVRSGSNAAGDAGGTTGRTVEDGPVGYNFHGFDMRFNIDWSDVGAILITQVMSCIPDSGSDLGDCGKRPYIANVGVDSWATTTSVYDGFKTHGGVSGGRFKPVTVARQLFTNYAGPLSLLATNPPPLPSDL